MTDNPQKSTERNNKGQFSKGNKGRPVGSKNKISQQSLRKIRSMTDEAFQALQENIYKGDMLAIKYVLDRVVPKERTVEFDALSPTIVLEKLSQGEITPEEARNLTTTITKLHEFNELLNVRQRMEALERKLGNEQ